MYKRQIDAIAGGGGLIALPTYLATGMPVHMAYGCGKLQCSMGSTAAALRFWKNGVLDGKFAALTAVAAMAASAVATPVSYTQLDVYKRQVVCLMCSNYWRKLYWLSRNGRWQGRG